MTYEVHSVDTETGTTVYKTSDNKVTCVAENPEFQQWLRDNADNLPADIQAKVEAGELTIQDADS